MWGIPPRISEEAEVHHPQHLRVGVHVYVEQAGQFLIRQVLFLVELTQVSIGLSCGATRRQPGVDSGSLLALIDQICAAHRPTSKVCSKDA
jgi:hypothetical protein